MNPHPPPSKPTPDPPRSPEAIAQLRKFRGRCFATVAHDMWAAGVLLHALLSGFFPYPSTEGHDELFQVILDYGGIDRNGKHWDGVPEQAKDLVADLLNPDDGLRLTAGQALSSAFIGSQPSGRPPRALLADSAGSSAFLTTSALSYNVLSVRATGSGSTMVPGSPAAARRTSAISSAAGSSAGHVGGGGAGGPFDSAHNNTTDDDSATALLLKMQAERAAARQAQHNSRLF